MAAADAVHRELARLRRGRALQAAKLRPRVGPRLRAACAINGDDPDGVIRQKLTALVEELVADFPAELRLAARAALAIDRRAGFAKLEAREWWLANEQKYSARTARRRVDEACARLGEALCHRAGEHAPTDPEQGWYVGHLNALLCLDTPTPELYEERTIVATRGNLSEIWTRFTLPPAPTGTQTPRDLHAKVLHGAQLRAVDRLGETHFRHCLVLPTTLDRGDVHQYTVCYRIPPGQPMRTHYVLVPLVRHERFQVRVRFDPNRPPEAVWRLDRVAPRLLDEEPAAPMYLSVDGAGDLRQEFADLVQGFGYGIAWRPAPPRLPGPTRPDVPGPDGEHGR